MAFDKKAQRSKQKLRLCITGASGSGKTYSALLIAQGLGGKIGMIDSENGSGSLYENLCDYYPDEILPPFEPEKYIAKIKEAESCGIDVLIIDSLTHVWAGEGGLLTIHSNASKTAKNSFTAWDVVNPRQHKLIQAILASKIHIIITLRSKVDYILEQNDKGKQIPRKVGLAPIFREGLDYEFTSVLDLSLDGHIAQSTKDRTGLFDDKPTIPSIETGKLLSEWLNLGIEKPDYLKMIRAAMNKLTDYSQWDAFREEIKEWKSKLTPAEEAICVEFATARGKELKAEYNAKLLSEINAIDNITHLERWAEKHQSELNEALKARVAEKMAELKKTWQEKIEPAREPGIEG